MSPRVAEVVGLAGSALMVLAFLYSNRAARLDLRLFNALNLVGSLLLLASLTVEYNLASLTLEVVWAAIAAWGLLRALRRSPAG